MRISCTCHCLDKRKKRPRLNFKELLNNDEMKTDKMFLENLNKTVVTSHDCFHWRINLRSWKNSIIYFYNLYHLNAFVRLI